MTERLPGKLFQNLHTKPWFFSGKVPEIKYSYTSSGLTPSGYPIRPRSIVPGSKLENSSIPTLPPQDDFKTMNLQREFKEYSFIRENEVLITIEHCDNCEAHSSSTRHDPIKYLQFAQRLKNTILSRYPMVKILTKPLSKLDPAINQRRLGAFEVQIAKKTRGVLLINEIHSKLSSRKWPDISEVIFKIAQYLPTCQLFVTVFDENSQEKILKGLKVQIRPKALDSEMQRPVTSQSNIRPKSAVSVKSFKSIRASSAKRCVDRSVSRTPLQVYEKVTDRDGMCLFEGVPLDIYEIQVVETKEFRGAVKVFNTFEEKVQNLSLNVYIGIKSRENSNLVVVLKDLVVKCEVSGARVSVVKDAEEYLLAEVKKGVYEISIPRGEYLLQITSAKYKEIIKKITARDHELLLTETLELKSTKDFTVTTYDALSGEGLSGVLLHLLINNTQSYEGMSKSSRFSFKLTETGQFYLKSHHTGYYKSKIYLNVNSDNTSVSVPLVPVSHESPIITISWTRLSDDIEVHGEVASKELSLATPKVNGYVLMDKLKTHGFSALLLPQQGSDLRLSIAGLSQDVSGTNGFVQAGVSVQFYSFGHIRASLKPSLGCGKWWDCGIYSVEKRDFFETNFVSEYRFGGMEFFEDVLAVVKHLFTVESVQNTFGFEHGVTKQSVAGPDVVLSAEIFKKHVSQLVSEDFLQLFVKSISSAEGISLDRLSLRYGKYTGLGLSPYKKIESFAKDLGLGEEDLVVYKKVIGEYFHLKFPSSWDVTYDDSGRILYVNEEGMKVQDYPAVYICRQKILEMKKKEVKEASRQKTPTPNSKEKKEDGKNSEASVESSKGSSKKSENKKNFTVDKETRGFIKEVNSQCEMLYGFAVQSIEFYKKIKKFDRASHVQLIQKIEEFLENCELQLETEQNKVIYDMFEKWREKFTAIWHAMKEIEEAASVNSSNAESPSKLSKSTPLSSKSSSVN